MKFKRELDLTTLRQSAFLFGPRMVGKSTLLGEVGPDLTIDLLNPTEVIELRVQPERFWQQVSALKPKSLIVIDEIQRLPELLDYVQLGIQKFHHRFILSGSSARKLKRSGANLLGGRARELHLHPLTAYEIGETFRVDWALQFGTLPHIASFLADGELEDARTALRSYYTTYIREEIQAEAITRNIGAFQRFLQVAAQCNAQVIEFSNISREASVPASTVKEYFSILEDTLIASLLWPWDRSERKKARPKLYFFDCGALHGIQNQLIDPPTKQEEGFLFETWVLRELYRLRDYTGKPHEFSFWREGKHEIDILISDSRGVKYAIECKRGSADISRSTLEAFRSRFPKVAIKIVSMDDTVPRMLAGQVEVIPWRNLIDWYRLL